MIMKSKQILDNTELLKLIYILRLTKTTRDNLLFWFTNKSKESLDIFFGMILVLWSQGDINHQEFEQFQKLIEGRGRIEG